MPESIRDTNTGITLKINDDGSINTNLLNTLIPVGYDEIELVYDGEIVSGVKYKLNDVILTELTLTYLNNKLISVKRI